MTTDQQGGAGSPAGPESAGPESPAPEPGPEPATTPSAGLRDLLPLLRPYRRSLALAAGLSLAGAAAALAQPALVGRVISAVGARESVLPAVVMLVAVLVAGAVLGGRRREWSSPPGGP